MNKTMNRKGIALYDLLAAILLFSVVTVLLMNIISIVSRAQQSILVQEDKTATGLIMTRQIENQIDAFNPTSVSYCDLQNRCLLLEKAYELEYNPVSGQIEQTDYVPALTLQIEFDGVDITIDSGILDAKVYSLDLATHVEIVETDYATIIYVYIYLVDKFDHVDEFISMYSILK
ncbi:MAG: hypothetical protein KKE16_00315 [Firmicutes bacterium]|nr:hypothetical protein [Bacillota bacterium]